jgi:hypothetical protein
MMMMAVSEVSSNEQRNLALVRANQVRTARATMKGQAKAGELDVCAVLRDPPSTILTANVGDVVKWAPGIGDWRAKRILNGLARANAKVSHLGEATRQRIASRLSDYLDDGGEWNGYTP